MANSQLLGERNLVFPDDLARISGVNCGNPDVLNPDFELGNVNWLFQGSGTWSIVNNASNAKSGSWRVAHTTRFSLWGEFTGLRAVFLYRLDSFQVPTQAKRRLEWATRPAKNQRLDHPPLTNLLRDRAGEDEQIGTPILTIVKNHVRYPELQAAIDAHLAGKPPDA